jgi:N-acetyl-alpha-D-glucosaminyl L-malate synthase BshA
MKPLRIGIACYPTFGGSGVMATELGLALADRGHEIHMFSYARPSRLQTYHHGVEFHNVTVSSYPLFQYPPYDLALASTMREVMAERELDILHVHYAVPHALCAFLAREMLPDTSTRIVTTLHGTDITILGRDPFYRDVIRFGLEKSDAVISVSQWLKDQTAEAFGYTGDIHVVPNFVDRRRFRPQHDVEARREFGGGEHPILVHTSNFRILKRVADTVDVLRRLESDRGPMLLLVGDGPDLSHVRDEVARLGMGDRVRFLGEIENVETVVAAADVALFPSESESFGLSALEAMACGVPVITTRVGGLPEVVIDGESGYLHEVGDTKAMAASVDRLLANDDARRAMGQAGVDRAEKLFSLEAMLERHESLYASVLDGLDG